MLQGHTATNLRICLRRIIIILFVLLKNIFILFLFVEIPISKMTFYRVEMLNRTWTKKPIHLLHIVLEKVLNIEESINMMKDCMPRSRLYLILLSLS